MAGFGVSGGLSRNLELKAGYQLFFDLGGDSFNDNALSLTLNWHFRQPKAVVAAAEPAPAAQPVAPAAPPEQQELDRFELIVQFDFDKSDVKAVYRPQFEEIAEVLQGNPDINMTIEGHTCWIGTEQYNQGLSQRRAQAVKDKFMQEYGIADSRIETIGYGESRPMADNKTLTGRQRNRRAIAVILQPRINTQ